MKITTSPNIPLSNCKHSLAVVLIAAMLFSACRKDEEPAPTAPTDVFYRSMTNLTLEVAYEPNAEPYVINFAGDNVWHFTELNIESLFVERPIALDVIIPQSLSDMTALRDFNKDGYTLADISGLADKYRKSEGDESSGNIFVVFLDGYYEQDDTLRKNVMGLNITGTTIVAVFKPLIAGMFIGIGMKEFTEQSVIIHEIGHALGLVNNGVPLTSQHQDTDHNAHCTNPDCVMYWENEGLNIQSFAQNYYGSNQKMIFGDECVRDVREYMPP